MATEESSCKASLSEIGGAGGCKNGLSRLAGATTPRPVERKAASSCARACARGGLRGPQDAHVIGPPVLYRINACVAMVHDNPLHSVEILT
eukprot:914882-Pyramimonas_sp.AAC.1